MKKTNNSIFFLFFSLTCFGQNSLLVNPVTQALPFNAGVRDIELISNGTDVALVAASSSLNEIYVIDIADNDPADADGNMLTEITNLGSLVDAAIGSNGATINSIEVNPISKSIYVLAEASGMGYFFIKIENDGATVTVLDNANLTHSLISWDGINDYKEQDLTWDGSTLYISAGSWSLDGEVATVSAPFAHNAGVTSRATSMFKTNWGGGYHTDAPLESMAFGTIDGVDRLMGVTVCAPGFSIETSEANGSGVLEVKEVFNVNGFVSKKVVHQNQYGDDYLFALHGPMGGPKEIMRIGQMFLDGTPITNNEYNADAVYLREFSGDVSPGITDEQFKVYPGLYDEMAFWDDCNLLVLENGTLKLLETSPICSSVAVNELIGTEFTIWPNPSSDQVNIDLNELSNVDIFIYSANGEQVVSSLANTSLATLDVSELPAGNYTVVLSNKGESIFSEKLILK